MSDYKNYLFRGKRKDNGEWVEGFYCKYPHQFSSFLEPHIFVSSFNAEKETGSCTAYPVIPETVGQYTGSIDKNRTKIFEGDIVRAITHLTDIYVGAVTFENGAFWYKNWSWFKFQFKFEKTEIIGNIYDNPELIGELKDD